MRFAFVYINYLLIKSWKSCSADLFSSVIGMEVLLETREHVIYSLEKYISDNVDGSDVISRYIKRYKSENRKASKDITGYLSNPVNAYVLIKSLTVDVKFIQRKLQISFPRNQTLVYPGKEDLRGAVQGLKELQVVYNLNVTTIADGQLFNHSSILLTSRDCYELGKMLVFNERSPIQGLQWLKESLRKYKEDDEIYGFNERYLMKLISDVYFALGDKESGQKWIRRKITWKPGDIVNVSEKDDLNEIMKENQKRAVEQNELPEHFDIYKAIFDQYHSLCRGEYSVDPAIDKGLKCYLKPNHPLLQLSPMKVEELYKDPGIYLMHDVIRDDEIEILKVLARPTLRRALIFGNETTTGRDTEHRVTKLAWVRYSDTAIIAALSRRVAAFTGLRADDGEPLQVANYGIGGYYWPHYDYYNGTKPNPRGNRISTVIFYMSEVPEGGATVFLDLGVSVFPKKGAALFWMNVLPSGEVNGATLHAACPVLMGSKWVGVLWQHQIGHELLKPCGLTPSNSPSEFT